MVKVMELVNIPDCDSGAERLAGSSPVFHPSYTKEKRMQYTAMEI